MFVNDKNILFVSGVFGEKFSRVHAAVEGFRCIMFCNNPSLGKDARNKGWEVVYVDHLPISKDYLVSSLQSKYVKFLQFLKDYPEFNCYNHIIYSDHKTCILPYQLHFLIQKVEENKSILLISNRQGYSIRNAVEVASSERGQERYQRSLEETVDWIQSRVDAGFASWDSQIYATGFVSYKNYAPILPLLDEVYDVSLSLGQPHCQIIFSALCQEYKNYMQWIYWEDAGIKPHCTPLSATQHFSSLIFRPFKSFAKSLLRFFGADVESIRKKLIKRNLIR